MSLLRTSSETSLSPILSETNDNSALGENHLTDDGQSERKLHNAAIYLQEGLYNDKFDTHPNGSAAVTAYVITHNFWFYLLDLIVSTILLLLAFFEPPAVIKISTVIHATIELSCLFLIAMEVFLRIKWLGIGIFKTHFRSAIKAFALVFMMVEAIVVMARNKSHFRVTRCIRPLFLLDCFYCTGLRRFIRQIILSLPPILDMLLLVLFNMLLFSILGFYLFANIPNNKYFESIQDSFISLFVLLTTANYPDVMMPAYNANRINAAFFIIYLAIELYFLMNLMLAVAYNVFSIQEKTKLKKLLLHKRASCRKAFDALGTDVIELDQFSKIMHYFNPYMDRKSIYLSFKTLDKSGTGSLNLEEFLCVFEMIGLKWKLLVDNKGPWFENFFQPFKFICKILNKIVKLKCFDIGVYVVIAANFIFFFINTIRLSVRFQRSGKFEEEEQAIEHEAYTLIFVSIYVVEMIMKLIGLGPREYFKSGWNRFDCVVTILGFIGGFIAYAKPTLTYIIILRPLRLLRLFKLKSRYREVLGTVSVLGDRMFNIAIVMILLFYSFAIVGMELFSKYDMKNCCVNTSVESQYAVGNNSGFYYLNNFDNILASSVTLFELTVVNNWYIIMNGYAYVTSDWSRIYFMVFYIATMVVMTVIVAFILESFMFRIKYKKRMSEVENEENYEIEEHVRLQVTQTMNDKEVQLCDDSLLILKPLYAEQNDNEQDQSTNRKFIGEKVQSKDDFGLRMYSDEVVEWLEEERIKLENNARPSQVLVDPEPIPNGVRQRTPMT